MQNTSLQKLGPVFSRLGPLSIMRLQAHEEGWQCGWQGGLCRRQGEGWQCGWQCGLCRRQGESWETQRLATKGRSGARHQKAGYSKVYPLDILDNRISRITGYTALLSERGSYPLYPRGRSVRTVRSDGPYGRSVRTVRIRTVQVSWGSLRGRSPLKKIAGEVWGGRQPSPPSEADGRLKTGGPGGL